MKVGAAHLDRIYVSWTVQWDLPRYVDYYLSSRKYAVNIGSRAAILKLISKYPGKPPLKKADVDFYLDRNVGKTVKIEKVGKGKKKA